MYEIEDVSGKTYDDQVSGGGPDSIAKRKEFLEASEMSGAVEPDRVWCKCCEKWIALQGDKYDSRNWLEHCAHSVHIHAAQKKITQYVQADTAAILTDLTTLKLGIWEERSSTFLGAHNIPRTGSGL